MAQQTINIGASPNDGTGTPLRTAFQYTNSNFSELYTAVGPSGNNIVVPGNATITGDLTVDTNVLKVDTTNNRVGILTASPAQAVDVASGNLQVRTGGTVISDTFTNYGAALQINAAGSLPLRLQIGGSNAYEITSANVHTWQNVGGVAGTAMTLNATGLGVGVSPSYKLHAVVTSGAVGAFRASTAAIARLLVGNTVADVELKVNANGDGQLTADASKYLGLGSGGLNDRVILDTSGNVGIGVTPSAGKGCLQLVSGINFPATQVASSDANTLDDYEEGTWTPVVADAITGGNVGTSTIVSATYTKIGRQVSVEFYLQAIGTAGMTAGNILTIRGFPFFAGIQAQGSFYTYQVGRNAATVSSSAFVTAGNSYVQFFCFTANSATGDIRILVSDIVSGTSEIRMSVTYFV